jgi:PAS domain S-box-containing protein
MAARTAEAPSASAGAAAAMSGQLAAFVAQAPMAICLTNTALQVIEVSDKWLELLGLEPDDTLGRSLSDLLPEAEERWGETWRRALSGVSVDAERVPLKLPDGRRRWLQVETHPWRDAARAIGGLMITGQDITELQSALERTRRSEQRLDLAAKIGGVHVWEMDYRRRELHKFGAEDSFFEVPNTFEMLAADIYGSIHPGDADAVKAAWAAHEADPNVPYMVEYRIRRTDGKEVWASSTSELILDERGKPSRLVGAMQNITERKKAEAALREAFHAAESANRAKSEFLANMSHEIRTPMNGVIGMNALLMRTALTPEQRKYAEAVRVSAEDLLGIINDILDISKLEAGKVELDAVDFSLGSLVEEVVRPFSGQAGQKGLEIATSLDDGSQGAFVGDPMRLRQVLTNLVANAVKFTERGRIAVDVRSDPIGPGLTRLRFETSDTGVGVPDEIKPRLFSKFQQADASTTRRYGGAGLGLSICRHLVALMGGEIGVHDQPGGGSVFWFEIELPKVRLAA